LRHLQSRGLQPVLIEGPKEKRLADEIEKEFENKLIRYKGSLQDVTAIISLSKFVICLDSAAVHLAAAVNTPTIALYGPQSPALTKPPFRNIAYLWNDKLRCRPCIYGKCKFDTNICMSSISSDDVKRQIDNILIP